MERVIVAAKTVQEALEEGLKKLNTTKDRVSYKVLQEPRVGFLGFIGRKDAKLEIIKELDKKENAKVFLEQVLSQMNLNLKVDIVKENSKEVVLNIDGDDLGIAIGHRGDTLDALEYISNLAVNKGKQDYLRVVLDANGYRKRRKKTLENLALKMSKKARRTGRKVMLDPMPPHERRIIHSALQNKVGVNTHSVGKDPYRKVVIVAE
ncbi:RNA-binding cell elongation regulator Jag/EloR [Orenia marismortui]|uniref:RNA-binding protein KhpB n=1 Tax=Orenia marismortui TaxID=46469 RepID=A0A4R8H9G9_9FIRM|nr:RNA-binding cell elongation regulator Jag/EloR [Orenia marismortui]TDX51771.1 spoIIIJ-associated protein [Orenia marismortui]